MTAFISDRRSSTTTAAPTRTDSTTTPVQVVTHRPAASLLMRAASYRLPHRPLAIRLCLAQTLSGVDNVPFIDPATGLPLDQPTIPMGPIGSIARARVLEAYVSANVLNHEISFGKQDDWLGPGLGGGFAYSNNAENIYSFRINRVEPLHIPGLSYITGPFRYDSFVVARPRSSQSGVSSTAPDQSGDPWVHLRKISLPPNGESGIRFLAHRHLGRQGTRAHHSA